MFIITCSGFFFYSTDLSGKFNIGIIIGTTNTKCTSMETSFFKTYQGKLYMEPSEDEFQ